MTKEFVSEQEILQEIILFTKQYRRMITSLNAQYKLLTQLRENLPAKYLGNNQIELFLKERNQVNEKEIKKLEVSFKKNQTLLKDLKNDKEKEDLESKIKDIQLELSIKNTYMHSYKKLLSSVEKNDVNYFYENLLLFIANCKHEATDLYKNADALSADLEIEYEYYSGLFLIEISEDALKDKGFPKVSADIRKAYMNSRKELKTLKQLKLKASTLKNTSEKLLSGFNSDEVNLRRFVDKYNKVHGF